MQVFFFGVVRFLPLVHCVSKAKEKQEDPLMFYTGTVFILKIYMTLFLPASQISMKKKKSPQEM